MNATEFLKLSEAFLIDLADYIEDNDAESEFDVEYSDGILNINVFEQSKQYVINKHSASSKIWFSSPVSGANYFAYDEAKKQWLDDDKKELKNILISELKNNFNFKK
jgi:iron donor protein CyaY